MGLKSFILSILLLITFTWNLSLFLFIVSDLIFFPFLLHLFPSRLLSSLLSICSLRFFFKFLFFRSILFSFTWCLFVFLYSPLFVFISFLFVLLIFFSFLMPTFFFVISLSFFVSYWFFFIFHLSFNKFSCYNFCIFLPSFFWGGIYSFSLLWPVPFNYLYNYFLSFFGFLLLFFYRWPFFSSFLSLCYPFFPSFLRLLLLTFFIDF